jgi:hypothetical protein
MGLDSLMNNKPKHTDLQRFIMEEDWDAARKELEYHPKKAKQWIEITMDDGTNTSALPLHLAVKLYAPLPFIKTLIECYPKAVMKQDVELKRFPLHFACLHNPYPELIDLLISSNRDPAFSKDFYGRLPLHYAAFGRAHEYIFHTLLESNPRGAQEVDDKEWLPLHLAVRYQCSQGAIDELIRAYPEGLAARTKAGKMTPADMVDKFKLTLDDATISILHRSKALRRQSSTFEETPTPELLEIDAETA